MVSDFSTSFVASIFLVLLPPLDISYHFLPKPSSDSQDSISQNTSEAVSSAQLSIHRRILGRVKTVVGLKSKYKLQSLL